MVSFNRPSPAEIQKFVEAYDTRKIESHSATINEFKAEGKSYENWGSWDYRVELLVLFGSYLNTPDQADDVDIGFVLKDRALHEDAWDIAYDLGRLFGNRKVNVFPLVGSNRNPLPVLECLYYGQPIYEREQGIFDEIRRVMCSSVSRDLVVYSICKQKLDSIAHKFDVYLKYKKILEISGKRDKDIWDKVSKYDYDTSYLIAGDMILSCIKLNLYILKNYFGLSDLSKLGTFDKLYDSGVLKKDAKYLNWDRFDFWPTNIQHTYNRKSPFLITNPYLDEELAQAYMSGIEVFLEDKKEGIENFKDLDDISLPVDYKERPGMSWDEYLLQEKE